jgi:hypothetical protein
MNQGALLVSFALATSYSLFVCWNNYCLSAIETKYICVDNFNYNIHMDGIHDWFNLVGSSTIQECFMPVLELYCRIFIFYFDHCQDKSHEYWTEPNKINKPHTRSQMQIW